MLDKQVIKEGQRKTNPKRMQDAIKRNEAILKVALTNDPDVDIILAEIQNNMSDKLAKHDEPL